jgi:hypothetical protein
LDTYVKFAEEEDAADAENIMNGRYYDGVAMVVFFPVTGVSGSVLGLRGRSRAQFL